MHMLNYAFVISRYLINKSGLMILDNDFYNKFIIMVNVIINYSSTCRSKIKLLVKLNSRLFNDI